MLDRVLHQWLQQQVWHQRPLRLRRDIEEHGQSITMAHLLDRNVCPGERYLFA